MSGYFYKREGWMALMACLPLAVPTLARADSPPPDAHALAISETLLDYCSKKVPSTTAAYRDKIARLVQGVSAEDLGRVRASEEYLKARTALETFTGNVDEHNYKRMCTNGLKEQGKPH